MKKRNSTIPVIHALCILSAFITISCKVSVPIREMSEAKSAITRAVEVKAEKYAPEELKLAQGELFKTHDQIVADDMKKAAEQALASKKAADDAIAKSLPLLAKDTLEEAKKAYSEAELLYAEKFAADELAAAGTAIKESEDLNAKTSYWDSYKKSLEAIRLAAAAKEKALAAIPELKKEIDHIRAEADVLKGNRGDEFAHDEMTLIAASLAEAENQLGQNSVKDAFVKVGEADAALKAASEKTYRALAQEKLDAAKASLSKAEASELKDQFAADIETATSLIKYSGEDFENKSYIPSMTKSNDALALLNTITITMEKKREEARMGGEKSAVPPEGKELKGAPGGEALPTEYVVRYNPKKRDCLWRIAFTVYKDARLWPLIYMANRDQIKDPDLIFPGQKFAIPPIPAKEAVKAEEKKEEKKSDEIKTGTPPDDTKVKEPGEGEK